MSDIELRVCHDWEDCLQCETLQERVWQIPDGRDIVPAHLLVTAVKNGGLLIGAFDGARMVGFAFGLLGREGHGAHRVLKHASHMLAVLPEFRHSGLGAALKWKQRDEALGQGIELMTWTFDPLQAVNAQLNLNRLGAVARRYLRDAYGVMTDGLNRGIASDRFEVEWYLASERVRKHAAAHAPPPAVTAAQHIYAVAHNFVGLAVIRSESDPVDDTIFVEIPPNINALRLADLPLAIEWRERTRKTFENAIEKGYIAADFVRKPDLGGVEHVGYLLMRRDLSSLLARAFDT